MLKTISLLTLHFKKSCMLFPCLAFSHSRVIPSRSNKTLVESFPLWQHEARKMPRGLFCRLDYGDDI